MQRTTPLNSNRSLEVSGHEVVDWRTGSALLILETPSLLAEGSQGIKKNIFKEKQSQPDAATSSCC
ncbi:hypothetical protein Acr_07g0014890 [Actinidia rufa]|uniref:Uncharacterized protein n=1 Tax=Actinidia rufa TaxID=165716 RepID=A0A7J0EY23_9ERIC|nr:hypothetical protein Acr_07g0014890 [Actinidia rufa]